MNSHLSPTSSLSQSARRCAGPRQAQAPAQPRGHRRTLRPWIAAAFALFVAACGGGGDGGSSGGGGGSGDGSGGDGSPSAAQGHWVGTAQGEDYLTGNGISSVDFVVLENGQLWGIYSTSSILGGWFGQSSVSGGQLSGSGIAYRIGVDGGVADGGMSATYTAKVSMSGQVADVASFQASYDASYDQPPVPVSQLAGHYGTEVGVGHAAFRNMFLTIDTSGNITPWVVSGQPNCGATGSIAPRASGKNVYDVHLVVQGIDCPLVNGATVDGIALYNPAPAVGQFSLLILGDSAQHTGFVAYTVK